MSNRTELPADESRPTRTRTPRPVGSDLTGLGLHLSFFASSALILIAFWFLLGEISCSHPHPRDSELIDKFIAEEPTFGELASMVREDLAKSGRGLLLRRGEHSPALSVARNREYDELLNRLSGLLLSSWESDRLVIWVSTRGLSITGSSKGFETLQNKPELLVDDLDHYRHPVFESYRAYRHLKGDWYLFLDVTT